MKEDFDQLYSIPKEYWGTSSEEYGTVDMFGNVIFPPKKTKGDEQMQSPKYSFKGWRFYEWLKGNWKTIKELIKVGAPLVFGMAIFKNNPALIGVITIIGKGIIDAVEYWFKQYP